MKKKAIKIMFSCRTISENLFELIPKGYIIGHLENNKFEIEIEECEYFEKLTYYGEIFGYPVSVQKICNGNNIDLEFYVKNYYNSVASNRYFMFNVNYMHDKKQKFYKLTTNGNLYTTQINSSYKEKSIYEKLIFKNLCIDDNEEFDKYISEILYLNQLGIKSNFIGKLIQWKEQKITKMDTLSQSSDSIVESKKNIPETQNIKNTDSNFYSDKHTVKKVESNYNTLLDINKIYQDLNKKIISQDKALKEILITIRNNFQKIDLNYQKSNILLVGPTGVGKSMIAKEISNILNVPFVSIDSNNYTQMGYVGANITDCLEQLYLKAGENLKLAEKGIIFIDEIDKLADNTSNDYIKTLGVQDALLKMLEGQEYSLTIGKDKKNIIFNSSKITFIAAGAFKNITSTKIEKNIGFGTKLTGSTENTNVDKLLIDYGMKSELIGRFAKIILLNNLSIEDIKAIVLSESSIFNYYLKVFQNYGIEFIYDDCFIDAIANYSIERHGGARGIGKALEHVFDECLWKIYTSEKTFSKLLVSAETVENPKKYILK